MNKAKLWTKDFIGVSAGNFFLFMTFYFLLVTLPVYILQGQGGTEAQAGLVTTVLLIAAILIRPFAGQWIGMFGRKKVFVTSLFLYLVTMILYLVETNFTVLLALRFFQGISFGMATTAAGAIVANIIPDSRRGEGMGYFVLSNNLAMAIGPFAGLTLFNGWGMTAAYIACIVISVIALIIGLSLAADHSDSARLGSMFRLKLHPEHLFEKSALPIALTGAFFSVGYASILSFVPVYAGELNIGGIASYFFIVYAVLLVLSRPFTGRWFDQYGENIIVIPSIVLFAAGLIVLSLANGAVLYFVAAGMIGIGWGTLFPSFQTIAIARARPERKAMATATFLSFYDFGIGVGAVVIGAAVAGMGFKAMYASLAVYVLIGILVYMTAVKTKKEKTSVPELNEQ